MRTTLILLTIVMVLLCALMLRSKELPSRLSDPLEALPNLPLHSALPEQRRPLAQERHAELEARAPRSPLADEEVDERTGGTEPGARAVNATVARPAAAAPRHGPQLVDYHDTGHKMFEGWRVQNPEGNWVRHGPWRAWHPNGEKSERGAYHMGAEDGTWTWWHPNGEQMAVGEYMRGVRLGPWTFWYDNGQKQLQGLYRDGKPEGRWDTWHANGLKWVEGSHENGEIHGYWTVWSENGLLDSERTGLYRRGTKVAD